MEKIRVEQHGGTGLIWCVGWLFTIGLLNLSFWKGVLAIVIWPVYLGWAAQPLLAALTRTGQ